MTTYQKFETTRQEMSSTLLEREEEVDIVLTALLCNQHALFVGPPGTAKSLLAQTILQFVSGEYFEFTLDRFTGPEHLFGVIDISAMKQGEYRRITTNMMPECDVAFIDEIWKGSSAINNTMLNILNERKFKNGRQMMACPLKLCVAASNEWPTEAKELGALFDRFLFRKTVSQVSSEDNIQKLMFGADLTPQLSNTLSLSELKATQVEIRDNIHWSQDANEAACDIRRKLGREGIIIGDRRLRQSALAAKSFAWLNGNGEVTTDDLEVLSHIWWVSPENQPQIVADVVAEIARPAGLLASQILGDAMQVIRECDKKDLAQCATASRKLANLHKQLSGNKDPRAKKAGDRIAEMLTDLRLATIAELD